MDSRLDRLLVLLKFESSSFILQVFLEVIYLCAMFIAGTDWHFFLTKNN